MNSCANKFLFEWRGRSRKIDVVCVGASLVDLTFQCKALRFNILLIRLYYIKVRRRNAQYRIIWHNWIVQLNLLPLLEMIRMVNGWSKFYRRRNRTQSYSQNGESNRNLFFHTESRWRFICWCRCIFNRRVSRSMFLQRELMFYGKAKVLLADCNLSFETLDGWCRFLRNWKHSTDNWNRFCSGKQSAFEKTCWEKFYWLNPIVSSKYLVEIQMRIISSDERITWLHSRGVQYVWWSAFENGSVFSGWQQTSQHSGT